MCSSDLATIDEIKDIIIGSRQGVPIRVGDVAAVEEGQELRTGAATMNGEETVIGTAMLLIGENSRAVAQRVDQKLKAIATSLPQGVIARTLYDRTALVEATIATVAKNLFEGALLVVVVLFLAALCVIYWRTALRIIAIILIALAVLGFIAGLHRLHHTTG